MKPMTMYRSKVKGCSRPLWRRALIALLNVIIVHQIRECYATNHHSFAYRQIDKLLIIHGFVLQVLIVPKQYFK